MNTSEIEIIIDKYYEGDTSLAEEKILRDFFLQKQVPLHLEQHRLVFAGFTEEQGRELENRDFDTRMTTCLSGRADQSRAVRMGPTRRKIMFVTGMAASILLLAGLFFTIQHEANKRLTGSELTSSAEQQYAEASEALLLVSDNLNYGLNQMARIKKVDQAMKNIQLFSKYYQCESLIINPDETIFKSRKTK